ncbi:TPA: hypothetical protein KRE09_003981 [Clostridioides difficile]|uniref:Uncharacterized protein n=3 Tax=root TaxID=1 RepID=A0A069A314_CLODI|nr:hypothetical protein [Clostridioides difficile]QVW56650.1 hypothetical protein [Clostridioides phage CD1801]ALP03590.1 hypothetical protein PCZ31_1660 [Clostridioides difficile]EJA6710996.1 hypothetical protein [Clostridioides difficile]EKG0757302.1 hypothetical protein [Clostridioides difficile]EKG0785773.1 hypothetical protein [Clostridioides difficile]
MNRLNYLNMRIKMFISSYLPLYLILLTIYSDKINSFDKIKLIIRFEDKIVSLFIIAVFILVIISFRTLIDLRRTKGNENHKFEFFNKTEDTIISYMMTYIVPILSTDFLSTKTMTINLILYSLIGLMYIKLNLIYLNPLWLLFGYSVYKSDNEVVIITNIPYGRLKTLRNTNLKSSYLGNDIYLIQRSENDNIN